VAHAQASRPAPALSPGLIWLMTITCTVTVAYEYWGWAGASITAAGFTVLGLAAWLADYRERVDGLRTAARASRAVGTRA